jgi:nicotinate-nucleotide pyrophosphorylase (carboxylating)
MTSREPVPPRRITPLATPTYVAAGSGFPFGEGPLVALVKAALDEDRAFDDVTTISTVISTRRARASLVARSAGTIAGVPLALAAFRLVEPNVEIRIDAEDGTRVARNDSVLHLSGPARGLLSAERVALNFLQRLSGVASLTARFVEAVQGTKVHIVDTRKTTPGWRDLEKYAVRCGGGRNHRRDLSDAVLIKDNHIAACEGDVSIAVARARAHVPAGILIQVECDTVVQVRAAIAAGVDALLLDNMSLPLMRESVQLAKGHCWTEASGGVTLETVRGIAESGVDRISIGALTHSAPALDLALDFE